MLAHLSHDLRTPLNAVIGFSEVMHRELLGPLGNERYRAYAVHIRESGQLLLRATEDMLALTRIDQIGHIGPMGFESGKPERIAAADVAREAWAAIEGEARRRGIACPPPTLIAVEIAADLRTLRQAMINVLAEAVAAAPAGGAVGLTMERDGIGGLVIEVTSSGARAASAADGACGTTVAAGQDGLGLGLARILVELLGGSLTVERGADACRGPNCFRARMALPSASDKH